MCKLSLNSIIIGIIINAGDHGFECIETYYFNFYLKVGERLINIKVDKFFKIIITRNFKIPK